ncbi:hypothetical protein [Streptomyces sp. UH6]|uniref:hypothetical protein n=1 Tax=Streptomyces sp. UH6 TaxID=2748379 RepID=UPI0015D4CDCE|nr:hypothetical protein [Streptomyces sp. UH6]NYV73453.1 hypothetical protein [Streptomyces sp. UH6]
MRMLNLKPIFIDHFQTLRTGAGSTETISKGDIVSLYGFPLTVSAVAIWQGWKMGGIGDLLTALSLMCGLLFNLLVLSFDVALRAAAQVRESQVETLSTSVKIRLIRQLQANTTYALVIALTVAISLAVGASRGMDNFNPWVTAALAYLLTHFVLVLMVILKRIRSIFRNELTP